MPATIAGHMLTKKVNKKRQNYENQSRKKTHPEQKKENEHRIFLTIMQGILAFSELF